MEAHRQEEPMFSQRTKKAWSSSDSGPPSGRNRGGFGVLASGGQWYVLRPVSPRIQSFSIIEQESQKQKSGSLTQRVLERW